MTPIRSPRTTSGPSLTSDTIWRTSRGDLDHRQLEAVPFDDRGHPLVLKDHLNSPSKVTKGAVGSDGVILDPPVLDQHPRLEQGIEGLDGEQFIP
jgi:hypothetical protein